jgi:hypothetical protein
MSLPFADWHKVAVRHLSLSPSEFWAMPMADWLALITPDAPALNGSALTQLMKDFPDD